jgi:hypothetical protein
MKSWCVALLAFTLALGCQKKNGGGAAQAGFTVSGVVLEKLDTPDGSYLRIGAEGGEVWARVPTADLAEGASVSVVRAQEMRNWESQRLQRTFDRLYIGSIDSPGQTVPQGGASETAQKPPSGAVPRGTVDGARQGAPDEMPQGMAQGIRQMGDRAAVPVSVPLLQKATGADGRTVAEILTNGPSLKGKTVSVRGQVVRVTTGLKVPNVSGGTWIHVQDGTGNQAQDTHDLTVATDEDVKVGDVLVLQGKVTMDDTGVLGGRVIVQGAKKR